MSGLIHLYCGDGKGKTSAAAGLALRAAGAGKRVLFTQFMKDGSSSEIGVLRGIENISVLLCKKPYGFYWNMTAQQRVQAKADYARLLREALQQSAEVELLVLDEIVSACNRGVVEEAYLVDFLKSKPERLEIVLTGRDPSETLIACADYVTEMKKIKHPYDRGIAARRGIEF